MGGHVRTLLKAKITTHKTVMCEVEDISPEPKQPEKPNTAPWKPSMWNSHP